MMWRALQSRGARRLLSSSSVEYYPGVKLTAFTNEMAFQSARCDIPTYRVVDEDGKLLNASHNVQVGRITAQATPNPSSDTRRVGRQRHPR